MTQRDPTLTRPWCLFRCGSKAYAIGLESVIEIVEVERLVRLPHAPPGIVGLCTYRRDVIPVAGMLHRGQRDEPSAMFVILILRTEQSTWGLRIDRTGAVVVEDSMEPSGSSGAEDGTPVLIGALPREDAVHLVIDPLATWRRLRESVDAWYGVAGLRRPNLNPGQPLPALAC